MKCFVTVGSTQFEQLIFTICEEGTLQNLSQIGIDNLVIQNGSGKLPECFDEGTNYVDDLWEAELAGLKISLFRYKNSIRREMEDADLIVGHAGAGTCIEVLELRKPFVAVINGALMDQHQSELANQLAKDGHLLCTDPEHLAQTLLDPSLFQLKPFPQHDPKIFCRFMENLLKEFQ